MPESLLLFVVTEDWYFCSHRLALAVAAKRAGFEVAVATRVRAHGQVIEEAGIRVIPFELSRRGMNPWKERDVVRRLLAIYLTERPDIVHHIAMKPVLYGSHAATEAGVPHIVNALAGLGYVFGSRSIRARLLRPWLRLGLRHALGSGSRLILQNTDDVHELLRERMVGSDSVRLIRGSGVDLTRFSPTPEPDGTPVVLLATRMLREKGVGEFIEASRRLRTRNVQARFVLVGDVDRENPGSLSAGELRAWAAGGNVEWLGHTDDMPGALAKSHIVCLPSYYREGVPKVLLEAAACGRPVIATDMPGCRDIVRHEKTGLLVAPRDPQSLADAIETLLRDRDSRLKYGKAARALVEAEFSIGAVVEQTLALYEELLSSPGATRMVVGSVVA